MGSAVTPTPSTPILTAAARVVIPHVLGKDFYYEVAMSMTAWPVIAEHTRLVVAFGGVALKNAQCNAAGIVRHTARRWLRRARDNDVEFVNISPLKEDAADFLDAEWWPLKPNTDTAMMLGLAHTLVAEDLHDRGVPFKPLHGFRPLSAVSDGQERRRGEKCRMGLSHNRNRCGPDPSSRAAHGQDAHHDHGGAGAPTRRPRRTTLLDGSGARGNAW